MVMSTNKGANLEDIIAELRELSGRKPLPPKDQEKAKKLMIGLREMD